MKRWSSLLMGLGLIALAFAAATRVADTRDGLIAEVITLFAGLVGVSLTLYGLVYGSVPRRAQPPAQKPALAAKPPTDELSVRPLRDLIAGVAGLCLTVVLVTGLGLSAGVEWAGIGVVLLLPMLAGSAYLCVRFAKGPSRSWKLEPRKPTPER